MVRAQDFEDGGNSAVVAATFWSNDIYAPSQFYPTAGVPWYPNNNWDGFGTTDWMQPGLCGAAGPWTYAALGIVVGSGMNGLYPDFENIQKDDWGWGVFYASDSNAADKRCYWWEDNQGYDCPGGWMREGHYSPNEDWHGAGTYPMGNPLSGEPGEKGGGAGCHFDSNRKDVDQEDSYESENLVSSYQCECNYNFKEDWSQWVWNFINSGKQKPGFEDRTWLHGGDKAPQWAIDTAMCWVNNPRDLIKIQNELFWAKAFWNNALVPNADYTSWDPSELRKYWGWNEIPASREFIDDAKNWDAIIIKLPAAVCNNAAGDWGKTDTPECLGDTEALQLDADLDEYVSKGKLLVGADHIGDRPGSYVVFVREYGDKWGDAGGEINWQREFFCTNYEHSSSKYRVVHIESDTVNPTGACYLDYAPTPVATTTVAPATVVPPDDAPIPTTAVPTIV